MSAKELIEEAKRQSEALKTISKWRATGFVLAAAGAALLYGGLHRSTLRIPFLAAGGIMAAAGLAVAVLCDLGIRNGRKNIEHILEAAERCGGR